jgi:hypothetical protein
MPGLYKKIRVREFAFHLEQRFQIPNVRLIFFHRLFGKGNEVRSDGRHPHRLAVLPHAGLLQRLGLVLHWSTARADSRSSSSITGSGRSNCERRSDRLLLFVR